MFYKRISDLHPLGKLKPDSTDWNDLEPIPLPGAGIYSGTTTNTTSITSDTKGNNIQDVTCNVENFPEITAAFFQYKDNTWFDTSATTTTYTSAYTTKTPEQELPDDVMKSEYYAKSLWFEVAITKNNDGKPCSLGYSKIQSKRVNAALLFSNIDEISAREISANVISGNSIIGNNLNCTVATANIIDVKNTLESPYGDINALSATSITATGVSGTLGIINNISGDNLYYNKAKFTDISVTGKADLIAEAAYWADVAEIYTADKGYLYGTLVKFGGEKEITVANDKANAVVSEKPAITLNAGNKNENALPIVLTGRSKVRTIHPVKKFDKIYLSETPGVGSISSYKISSATMPIGIALENKPYDEEGLVECILQLNFE